MPHGEAMIAIRRHHLRRRKAAVVRRLKSNGIDPNSPWGVRWTQKAVADRKVGNDTYNAGEWRSRRDEARLKADLDEHGSLGGVE